MQNSKHVVVDLFDCHVPLLEDRDVLHGFLLESIKMTDMTAMMRPLHIRFEPIGYSGFCILGESHISYHTYPEDKKIYIDLFSCRDFDAEAFVNYCMFAFLAGDCKYTIIERS